MKPDLPIDTQILWLAAELVEKGHCKGKLMLFDKICRPVAWCARGAIEQAASLLGTWQDGPAVARLEAKVGPRIEEWNDHPSRTAAEVALALRTA